MGTSILKGLLNSQGRASNAFELSYTACVRSEASLNRLKHALGQNATEVSCYVGSFTEAAQQSDVIMLGVPPGELEALAKTPGLADASKGKLIISLLAGVSCIQVAVDFAKHNESNDSEQTYRLNIARVIPTIAAQVGDSVTLIADTEGIHPGQLQLCTHIFQKIGTTQNLPESLMNEATATGAVCHAIAIAAVDAAVDASVAKGLPRATALSLAANSLRSAAGLLGGEMTPEELKAAMSVPSGITINSMLKLDRANMRYAVEDTVGEAIDYARSMA